MKTKSPVTAPELLTLAEVADLKVLAWTSRSTRAAPAMTYTPRVQAPSDVQPHTVMRWAGLVEGDSTAP